MGNFMGKKKKRSPVTNGRTEFGYEDVTEEFENKEIPKEKIVGEIPQFLDGKLYRQSGGAFLPAEATLNPIDPLGMVICLEFKNGDVKFTNKFYDSAYYRHWKETKDRAWDVIFPGCNATLYEVPKGKAIIAENNNVTFWRWSKGDGTQDDEKLYIAAASEQLYGECALLDDNCNTIADVCDEPGAQNKTMKKYLRFFSAHYAENEHGPKEGDLHAGYYMKILKFLPIPTFQFGYVVPRSGPNHSQNWEILKEVELCKFKWTDRKTIPLAQGPAYAHASAESENYLIQTVGSFRMKVSQMVERNWDDGFFGMFSWDKSIPLEFNIYDKKTGEIVAFGLKAQSPAMTFHVVNAYEIDEGRKIILEMSWLDGVPTPFTDIEEFYPTEGAIMRFTIDLDTKSASEEKLCGDFNKGIIEFACVNPHFWRKKNRYFWGLGRNADHVNNKKSDSLDTSAQNLLETSILGRFDCDTKQTKFLELKSGDINTFFFTEPQFVPTPGKSGETDGVLLLTGNDCAEKKSYGFVVDANNMKELCRFETPIIVNHGLHNVWVPKEDLYPLRF
eukprot:gene72-441_t